MSTEIKAITEKKLSDYLHLYLGCEAKSSEGTMTYKLSSIDVKGRCMFYDGHGNDMWLGNDFKLILRPLSDMTEEEREIAVGEIKRSGSGSVLQSQSWESMRYLLSKHFDLFGLIDAGIAIDKTKHKE